MSAKDMHYTVGPVIAVRLNHKDNGDGILHNDKGLVAEFLKFCEREELINVGGGTTGPGIHTGHYTSIKGDRDVDDLYFLITKWLDEHGVTAKQEWR